MSLYSASLQRWPETERLLLDYKWEEAIFSLKELSVVQKGLATPRGKKTHVNKIYNFFSFNQITENMERIQCDSSSHTLENISNVLTQLQCNCVWLRSRWVGIIWCIDPSCFIQLLQTRKAIVNL